MTICPFWYTTLFKWINNSFDFQNGVWVKWLSKLNFRDNRYHHSRRKFSICLYWSIHNKTLNKKKQKREYKKSKILSKKWEMQRKDVNMICTNMKFICDTQTSRNTSFGKEPTQSSNYILFYCTNLYHARHEHLHNRLHIVSLPLLLNLVWIYICVYWSVCVC